MLPSAESNAIYALCSSVCTGLNTQNKFSGLVHSLSSNLSFERIRTSYDWRRQVVNGRFPISHFLEYLVIISNRGQKKKEIVGK